MCTARTASASEGIVWTAKRLADLEISFCIYTEMADHATAHFRTGVGDLVCDAVASKS